MWEVTVTITETVTEVKFKIKICSAFYEDEIMNILHVWERDFSKSARKLCSICVLSKLPVGHGFMIISQCDSHLSLLGLILWLHFSFLLRKVFKEAAVLWLWPPCGTILSAARPSRPAKPCKAPTSILSFYRRLFYWSSAAADKVSFDRSRITQRFSNCSAETDDLRSTNIYILTKWIIFN